MPAASHGAFGTPKNSSPVSERVELLLIDWFFDGVSLPSEGGSRCDGPSRNLPRTLAVRLRLRPRGHRCSEVLKDLSGNGVGNRAGCGAGESPISRRYLRTSSGVLPISRANSYTRRLKGSPMVQSVRSPCAHCRQSSPRQAPAGCDRAAPSGPAAPPGTPVPGSRSDAAGG